jgi:integron integrase
MKPGAPPLQSARLLDQVRERVRYMHYSLKTEKAYLYWVRFFVRWSAKQPGGMRHPRDMAAQDVEAFLSMMANERNVSASTHNQALSAVLFLYREVLNIDLPWLNNIGRPKQAKRIPSVLTKDEVAGLLAQMEGTSALLARLLYGTGMRLMEGLRLRVKDVDFERHVIVVREAKGGKDRVVMMPRSLAPALRVQMLASRAQWEADRQAQRGGVETPHALEQKYPNVGHTWVWSTPMCSRWQQVARPARWMHWLPFFNYGSNCATRFRSSSVSISVTAPASVTTNSIAW